MLTRLAAAQRATTNSLQAAQDFAANAAHELRTPLTAMRADLDTLRIHDLPPTRNATKWSATCRVRSAGSRPSSPRWVSSRRVSWRRPRTGKPSTSPTLLDRVARENMRTGRRGRDHGRGRRTLGTILGLAGRAAAGGGQPGAQRDHPRQRDAIVLAAHRQGDEMTIVVDDNGRGLPADEHVDRARAVLPGQYRRPGRVGAGAGAGRAAGGAARRPDRAVRRTTGWSAGDPDGLDRACAARDVSRMTGARPPAQQQHRGRHRGDDDEADGDALRSGLAQQHSDRPRWPARRPTPVGTTPSAAASPGEQPARRRCRTGTAMRSRRRRPGSCPRRGCGGRSRRTPPRRPRRRRGWSVRGAGGGRRHADSIIHHVENQWDDLGLARARAKPGCSGAGLTGRTACPAHRLREQPADPAGTCRRRTVARWTRSGSGPSITWKCRCGASVLPVLPSARDHLPGFRSSPGLTATLPVFRWA